MYLLLILLLWYADLGLPKWLQIFGTVLLVLGVLCETGSQILNGQVVRIEKVVKHEGDEDND